MDNKPLVDLVNINNDNVPNIPSDFPGSHNSSPVSNPSVPSVVNTTNNVPVSNPSVPSNVNTTKTTNITNINKGTNSAPVKGNVPKKKKKKFKYTFRKIPMLLPTKIFLGIMGGLFLLCIIAVILGIFIPGVAEFMWFNVRNPYYDLGFKLFNNIPSVGANLVLVLFLVILFLLTIQVIFENFRKIKYKIALIVSNVISCIVFTLLTLFLVLPVGLDLSTYNNSKINEKYFSDNVETVYTEEDIINLTNYYKNKVMSLSKSFPRIGGEIVYGKDLIEQSSKDLLNVSSTYPFLKGSYITKVGDLSTYEREKNNDGTMAYTSMFGVVVDSKLDKTIKLNTINHELCHTKGILRESEAEFCAYVAGISSTDRFSQYSAYYNAFYRLTTVINQIDHEKALDIEEDFTKLCLTDEYSEACNFYSKDINTFVEGTDAYIGYSYRLRNYKNHKDAFMNILNLLEKNFKAEFIIDDMKVTSGFIYNEISKGSSKVLEIRISVTDDNFVPVSNFIKNNQKFLMAFYQYDVDIEDELPEGQEALEYYVKPFDMEDYKHVFGFGDAWVDEYYYERVVRLLLEYDNDKIR